MKLTEKEMIDLFVCDKYHELAGMVTSYLKVKAFFEWRKIDDIANLTPYNMIVTHKPYQKGGWQLLTPREQEEVIFNGPNQELAKKLAERVNKLEAQD